MEIETYGLPLHRAICNHGETCGYSSNVGWILMHYHSEGGLDEMMTLWFDPMKTVHLFDGGMPSEGIHFTLTFGDERVKFSREFNYDDLTMNPDMDARKFMAKARPVLKTIADLNMKAKTMGELFRWSKAQLLSAGHESGK